ncbi:MAG: cytochrome c biogenesis protein CcsA [Fimbriimonas sp.]|nr:cytochrome c biogenesis protein CcsA [Fimbriimonas sp.]
MDLLGGVEKLKTGLRALFVLLMGVATVWSFFVPDAEAFQKPGMARIFLWHFPCPMLAVFLLLYGAWCSFRIFQRVKLSPFELGPETDHDEKTMWDLRSVASMELGYLFCILTMASGILFSEIQWGAWWSWDPRQTSFLIVLLIYAAYFALRFAYTDPGKRAAYSGAYSLFTILPSLFLFFVFPRLPYIKSLSLHPTDSILQGQIKGQYAEAVILILVLVLILTIYLFKMRIRAGLLEINLEKNIGQLENLGVNTTPTGVVRPVSVSKPD